MSNQNRRELRRRDRELLESAWKELSRVPATYTGRSSLTRSSVSVAKFKGLCERCGSPIKVGQDIRFHLDFGAAVHDGCRPPKVTARTNAAAHTSRVAARTPPPCPECHLEHADECW